MRCCGARLPAVLWTCRALGLAPLAPLAPLGGVRTSWGWLAYSWGLALLLAAATGAALYNTWPSSRQPTPIQSATMTVGLFRADVFVFAATGLNDAVTIAFLCHTKAGTMTAALNQLQRCEAAVCALEGAGGCSSAWRRRSQLEVALLLLVLVAFVVSVLFLLPRAADRPRQQLWGMAHVPTLPLQLFFCLLFGDQVLQLWLQSRALNRRLARLERLEHISRVSSSQRLPEELTSSMDQHHSNVTLLQDLHALRTLHAELRLASSLLNAAHSHKLLLLMLTVFLSTTTSIYVWLTGLSDIHESSSLALIWSALLQAACFGILTAGELVKRESKYTAELTQRILIYKNLPQLLRREVREFSHQLLYRCLYVSAYTFLPLDYTMLQAMLGTVTTYLIMMIQLSPERVVAASGAAAAPSS